MSQLRNIQENFQAYMLTRDQAVSELVVEDETADKQTRLAVYGNGYYYRFHEVLSDDFPMLNKLLGHKAFYELVCEYIKANPSTHFSVRYLGRHLERFLANKDNANPLWVELVRFEWALRNVLDRKDGQFPVP